MFGDQTVGKVISGCDGSDKGRGHRRGSNVWVGEKKILEDKEGGMRRLFVLRENDSGLNRLKPKEEAWNWTRGISMYMLPAKAMERVYITTTRIVGSNGFSLLHCLLHQLLKYF